MDIKKMISSVGSDGKEVLSNILNRNTGKYIEYKEVEGVTDQDVIDGKNPSLWDVYIKRGDKYYIMSEYLEKGKLFLEKDSIDEVRNISSSEVVLLKIGYYIGVKVSGYYEKGDTPSPIVYRIQGTSRQDDGASVIKTPLATFVHNFKSEFDVTYFGVKMDYENPTAGSDDTQSWQNAINYQNYAGGIILMPKGSSLITRTLKIYPYTYIRGSGSTVSTFVGNFEGSNLIEFLNGHKKDSEGNIIDYGAALQCKLEHFGITSNIPTGRDEFGRNTSFVESTALHLEGFRYLAKLYDLRILGSYKTAIYLFSPWGGTIDLIDINRASSGIIMDGASNGFNVNRFFGKRLGNLGNVGYSGVGISLNGGTNATITNSIIENSLSSSPAVIASGVTNFAIENSYFERQTTGTRTVVISSCKEVVLRNLNFENTYGIQISSSKGVDMTNINVYDNNEEYTPDIALRIPPASALCERINITNFKVNDTVIRGFPINTITSNVSLSKKQAEDIVLSSINKTGNFFKNPFYNISEGGVPNTGVTTTMQADGLRVIFDKNTPSSQYLLYSNKYTHSGVSGGSLYLICRAVNKGSSVKYMGIYPSSGSFVTREIPPNSEPAYFVCRINSAVIGASYSVRFGCNSPTEDIEELVISSVYLGFLDLKDVNNIPN